jgi:ADP-ribosylglycohydrolase
MMTISKWAMRILCGATIAAFILNGRDTPLIGAEKPKVTFNEAEFRDRVYACWLGKNIGGTLGVPFEGKQDPNNIEFYTNLKPGESAANDDLDLQMLWLMAMEENDAKVDARILGEYWLKYVPVDWNEYGVGKMNMKRGILPPLSGEFDNAQWKPSNGAWIRSEIWACLAPGCPALAAKLAREDACVDHGSAEGTLAEIFTASVESAAFVESDPEKLIAIGLSMIPENCGVARGIHTVQAAKKAGKDWKAARQDVIEATKDTGWFQAPRNVAFTVLGWLYGDGDFGKSLCIAINCGDDTDCTGATLGSIWGIIHGTKGIPKKWSDPIGTKITTCAIAGFPAPKDLDDLTTHTLAMTKRVLVMNDAPVGLTDGATDLSRAGELVLADTAAAKKLWDLSPYQIVWNEKDVRITLDYGADPVIKPGVAHPLTVTLENLTDAAKSLHLQIANVPKDWQLSGIPATAVELAPKATAAIKPEFAAKAPEGGVYMMKIEVSGADKPIAIPLTLIAKDHVAPDDLALASKGATATADSEYANEKPCAAKVIDGEIASLQDFKNRWHSALDTPHPHWIEVKLAKPAEIGRVVIRFADPQGYPVRFQCLVKPQGSADLKEVVRCDDNKDTRAFRANIQPIVTDTFRLIIEKSANPAYPNAAQVSEIELYPPTK